MKSNLEKKKFNACIGIISSRKKCLFHCLNSIYENFNYKYNYPIYILYFDDIYDSSSYINKIHKDISKNIHFISIPYKSPIHVLENEMFYNRKNINYVNSSFPITRKGYLHMCNFWVNFFDYPNTKFKEYDYLITHDDESGYNKQMIDDPINTLTDLGVNMGAYITGPRLKNGKPHQGHLDTRIGLWDFTKKFIIDNQLTPKYEQLNSLLTDNNAEYNFHLLPWSDTYVLNLKFAKNELWKKWISSINNSGGIYKYRWGDNEIISLFAMITQKSGMINLGYVENGIHNQGKFRRLQDIAPSIKDTTI